MPEMTSLGIKSTGARQPNRLFPHACRASWQGNRSITNVAMVASAPTGARPHSAPGRQNLRLLRPCRHCNRRSNLRRLGRVWTRAPAFAYALINAVAVSSSPALAHLALPPMSIMVGVGRGAREGVLVKIAEALETLEKIDVVVVDKPALSPKANRAGQNCSRRGLRENELLRIMASLEQRSGTSSCGCHSPRRPRTNLTGRGPELFDIHHGAGCGWRVQNRHVFYCSPRLLESKGITVALSR